MNIRHGIFFLIFLILSCSLWSQDIIESINISGMKRTKEQTVLNIIKVKEGDPIVPDLSSQVEQRLKKAGIFQEEMTVSLLPGVEGQILEIYLHDRWTLIGMPYLYLDNGKLGGGLFAFDSNLLGTQKLMVTSLMLGGESGVQAFLLYKDPALFQSPFNLTFALTGGRSEITLTDLSGETEWEDYFSDNVGGSVRLGYQFSDEFSLESGFSVTHWEDSADSISPPGEGISLNNLGLTLKTSYDSRYFYSLFSSGFSGSFTGTGFIDTQGAIAFAGEGQGSYGFVFNEAFLLKGSLGGGITNSPFHSLFKLGGSTGSQSLPSSSIASDRYLNGEVLAEIRVVKFSFGSITAPLFYETGILTDYYDETQIYHGIGGGLRFYLAKVAFPAMGLDYKYNFTSEYSGFSFFLGMAF